VVLIQSIVIFKKKDGGGGYKLKIITKLLYMSHAMMTPYVFVISLITILVVMIMMRRRWTVMMIWNILRMLLTI
jgi:hypothetical protein